MYVKDIVCISDLGSRNSREQPTAYGQNRLFFASSFKSERQFCGRHPTIRGVSPKNHREAVPHETTPIEAAYGDHHSVRESSSFARPLPISATLVPKAAFLFPINEKRPVWGVSHETASRRGVSPLSSGLRRLRPPPASSYLTPPVSEAPHPTNLANTSSFRPSSPEYSS